MGRRENAKKPLQVFSKLVGCDVFTGRYLPGKLTNAALDDFKEYKTSELSAEEVMETRWVTLEALRAEIAQTPDIFTPWLRIYMTEHAPLIFGADT